MEETADFALEVSGFGAYFKVTDHQHLLQGLKKSVFADFFEELFLIVREKAMFYAFERGAKLCAHVRLATYLLAFYHISVIECQLPFCDFFIDDRSHARIGPDVDGCFKHIDQGVEGQNDPQDIEGNIHGR